MKHGISGFIGASAIALAMASPALAGEHNDDGHSAHGGIERLVEESASDAAKAGTDKDAEIATPTMNFGEWGFDPELLSPDMRPGDDFFAYANNKWLEANPLPPEFSRFGAFTLLSEKSTRDVKALVDELTAKDPAELSGDEARIVNAFKAFLDTDAIDAAGLTHAQPHLNRLASASSLTELTQLWAEPGYASPVGGFVTVDAKQPDRYVSYVGIGGLGLPDRDYYTDTSEKGLEIQRLYKDYLTFLFKEAGYDDPAAATTAVYAFENRLARQVIWDRTVSRNRDLTYNKVSKEEMNALAGDVPFDDIMAKTGLDKSPFYVVTTMPPSDERAKELGLDEETRGKIGTGLPGMFEVLRTTPLTTLQAWSIKEFLSDHSSVLPSRFDKASFEFYSKKLRGTPEQRPRWKRAISATEGALGELVGKSYVERYFPSENKAAMDELVANLRIAMGQSIDEISWMSDATKEEARAKLNSFDPKIGYRDNLETYEGLDVTPDNPLANSIAASAWSMKDNISKLGKPIDRTEWFMLPQTVNAYYNATKNEIVFPAGILQQPFFGVNADIAVNYGAIGGVIGHEIGHGFDDQGSKSDYKGKLRNWWTDEDRAAFDERGDKLVAQYSAFCPFDEGETCVNGRLTLGENIGDVGGLSLAYRAYKIATKDMDVPVIDGLTGDQRFFLGWAQVWRSAQREENYRLRLKTGVHSPEEYRVNGPVRNMDAWYEAFGVTEDHAMYLPPEERVRIW
jgi:putative endopeptidase